MNKNLRLDDLYERAKRDVKGNYLIYNAYKRELEELELPPKEYRKAIVRIAQILKI